MNDREFEVLKRNFVETRTDHWWSDDEKYYAFVSPCLDSEPGAFGYLLDTSKIGEEKVIASFSHDDTGEVMWMIKDYVENTLKIKFEI